MIVLTLEENAWQPITPLHNQDRSNNDLLTYEERIKAKIHGIRIGRAKLATSIQAKSKARMVRLWPRSAPPSIVSSK
jgi:hypothetical protein